MEKRCYGCMKIKTSSPVCEHCGYDERMTNAPHHLPAGTILRGQYLVGRVLGQGGFGITYLGRDINLDMPIAIKEYYPTGVVTRESTHSHSVTVVTGEEDTRFAENRNRFLREAQTLARLEDVPEVVQVKNFFAENNTAYIIMGYVKGITLKEYMRRKGGRLTAEETLRLLEPLLEAMGRVHALGLVHRDISPDNIMLQPNGRVRLIDFGAAHAATRAGDKSTQAVLKHGFAPMEQYQSKGHLGPWTDVYAMCATIYNCLTGKVPPNATDRVMGAEDFDWDSIPGLTQGQKAALAQGVNMQVALRTQSMEALCEGLFGKRTAEYPEPEKKTPEPKEELPVTVEIGRKSGAGIGTVTLVGGGEKPNPIQPEPYTTPVNREEIPPQIVTAPVEPKETEISGTGKKEPGKTEKRGWLIPVLGCAAGVVLLAVCLLVLTSGWKKPDDAVFVRPTETEFADTMTAILDSASPTEPQETVSNEATTLPEESTAKISNMLMEHDLDNWESAAYSPAFRTKALRDQVVSITFLDTLAEVPADAVDASYDKDGSVLAWIKPNGALYDLYIAADGVVCAPPNSEFLFGGFEALERIEFGDAFETTNVTNMCGMFTGCENLEMLDISGFDTSQVRNMISMFQQCSQISYLDVSGFDTSMVNYMTAMFNLCNNLTYLDLSGFDTSKVKSMELMFGYCEKIAVLDLSGFDTSNVQSMSYMFYECLRLKELDVSGFDTRAVTDIRCMFYETDGLKNVDGNFDVSSVEFYEDFMDPGDKFNGKPWKQLFQ